MSATPARDLEALVEQFRRDTGYPTEADKDQERLRVKWREKMLPENIGSLSRIDLTGVDAKYVRTCPHYVAEPAEWWKGMAWL